MGNQTHWCSSGGQFYGGCCASCGAVGHSDSSPPRGSGFTGKICRSCGSTSTAERRSSVHVHQEPALMGIGVLGVAEPDINGACIPSSVDLAIDSLLGKTPAAPSNPTSASLAKENSDLPEDPFQRLLASKVVVSSSESFFLAKDENGEPTIVHSIANMPLEERPEMELEGGIKYRGQWRGGEKHGYGVLERPDGLRYEGQFADNHVHGHGVLYNKDSKVVYQGQWEVGRAQGQGQAWQSDGSSYEGEWQQDRKTGRGTEIWPDGAAYEGEFLHGVKNGVGQYRSNTGAVYRGEFRNDKVEGEGVYTFPDGRVYSGQCKAGTMNGIGTMQWPNGSKYQGGYVNGAKSGEGTFAWPDGRMYWGQWSEGVQEGFGVTISPSGVASQGVWRRGKEIEGHRKPMNHGDFSPSMAARSLQTGGFNVPITPSPSGTPTPTNKDSALRVSASMRKPWHSPEEAPEMTMPKAAIETSRLDSTPSSPHS
mmetsp:Transcript_7363/g.16110  ORF Transcript_7363/g.16110 Transcript_7363/m.16110 type:complete len:480 (+) Transcript_7363:200-1639(+)